MRDDTYLMHLQVQSTNEISKTAPVELFDVITIQ